MDGGRPATGGSKGGAGISDASVTAENVTEWRLPPRPYRGFVNRGTVTEWWPIGLEICPHQTDTSPMRWVGYPNVTGLSRPTGG